MSATTEQKVDFLLKKVGFTLSKTGSVTGTGAISGGTTKEPFAESIPSPLVVPDTSIWNQSLSIPTTPPGSDTSIVKVYSTSSAHRMTADSSVSGSRAFIAYSTYNNTSSARLTDWIDTQFGTAYVLKVYKGDPNSGGTLLPAGGSGSNDGWFFDYSSGVLNFNGSGLPSGVTDSNIYIVGYRYIGSKGVSSPAQINPTNLFVSGISTFAGLVDINAGGQANTFKIEDLTAGRVVLAGTGGEIEDSANLKFNTTTSEFEVVGHTVLDSVVTSGIATIGSVLYVGGTSGGTIQISNNDFLIDAPSGDEIFLRANGGDRVLAGRVNAQTELFFDNAEKFRTTAQGIEVTGHSELDNVNIAGVSTFVGVGTFQSDLSVAGQLKGYTNLVAPHSATTKNFTVTVQSKDASHRYNGTGSGNAYLIDGIQAPILTLTPGRTYRFTNNNTGSHPLKFYLEADKTTNYTTGVNFQNTYTEITISDETPNVLHYQCTAHGYMGNAIITNSNVVNTNYAATLRGGLNVSGGESILSSATVSDLTSGRVVLAGGSGALQDNSNLTFNGSQLGITGTVNASSTITGTEFHTGSAGSAIRVTSNTISGPATFTLDPATIGNNTGKVIIAGDLQVDGTTTTVNSTTVNIVDKNIQVATGAANDAAANGGGITVDSGDGDKTFQFEATGDNWGASENLNLASGKAYKINNTSVLNATTLGSGVVNSSLTSVGTLSTLNVSGLAGIGSLTVAGVTTTTDHINIDADDKAIRIGDSQDIQIFHNTVTGAGRFANSSYIENNTGNLFIRGIVGTIIGSTAGEIYGQFLKGDKCELRFDNNVKFVTTNTGIDVTGNVVSDGLVVDGNSDLNGRLDVDGHAGIGSLTVAGVSTFSGNIDANGSLDVDGHTELDNVNIVGVATITGVNNFSLDLVGNSNNNSIVFRRPSGGANNPHGFRISQHTGGGTQIGGETYLAIDKVNKSNGAYSAPIAAFSDDGLHFLDSRKIHIGGPLNGGQAEGDLQIYNIAGVSYLRIDDGNPLLISKGQGTENIAKFIPDAQVELYFNNNLKLETNNTGVVVTGIVSATTFQGNATTATLATDLAINGTNQLLYQASNNDSAVLPTGNAGQILQSNGSGNAPQWVTSAPAGAIEGITIREESTIVGSANSISTINFIGQAVTADAAVAAGIATVTIDAIQGILVKEDEANVGTAITAFDFSGSLVDVDAASNTGIATVQIDALSVKDQGSIVGTAGSITTFNFLGDGVTATASGETATVSVSAITGLGVSMGGGSVGTAVTGIDFEGSLVSVEAASNTGIATVRVEGLSIKDEGSTVGTAGSITTLNFVGSGIAAAVSGNTATVTASGGATQDDIVALAIALG